MAVIPPGAHREILIRTADRYFWGLIWSTIGLFIGAVMEYLIEHANFEKWCIDLKARRLRPRRWLLFLPRTEWLAIILVVGGIGGEGIFEYRAAIAEDAVREFDRNATLKAQDDASSRLEAAKRDIDDARASLRADTQLLTSLQAQVKLQTPRWKLLEDSHAVFEDALRPFSGQMVTVLTCGRNPEPEEYRLGQDIVNFIGMAPGDKSRGAGWIAGYATWERCGPGGGTSYGGNLIAISGAAGDSVKSAARMLYETLNSLGIYTPEIPSIGDPYGDMERFMGADSPNIRAMRDPKSIVLLIGSNPMFNVSGFKSKKP